MLGRAAIHLLVVGFVLLSAKWHRPSPATIRTQPNAKPTPRPLKPRTPDDCPGCRAAQPNLPNASTPLKPYSQVKSPRGRKKRIATAGFACPNHDCLYYGVTDEHIHALVGYGGHGRREYLQDLKCQACQTKFSVRYGTALYRLKTPSRRVGEVLSALAEGLSVGAAVRATGDFGRLAGSADSQLAPQRSRWRDLSRDGLAVPSLLVIILLAMVALAADKVAPYDPTAIDMTGQLVNGTRVYPPYGPSPAHWFGTDQLGRDIFSRVVFGIRTSLFIGIVVRGGVMLVGVTLGVVAGYWPGLLRDAILRFTEIMLSFPPLLIAMAITAVLRPSLSTVTIALILVGWPDVVRLVYGQVLITRETLYVESARSLGASELRILWRHILPNILDPIVVAFSMGIPGAVMYEAGLSFFGFGIQPPTPSLGSIISDGRGYMSAAPWYPFFPGLALVVIVLAFNFLGEGLLRLNQRRQVYSE